MRVGLRGDTGCQKRPGKWGSGGRGGGGGSPGRAPLPRSRIPSPRCRVRGTKCADGRSRWAGGAWRARGSPRLGFPTLWRSSSRDTRPPTLRWALVRGRLQAPEARWALRAAPGQGTQPPRAVPDPESPHPPRGGGWMARGLLSIAQLGCLLRVPYGGLGGGQGGPQGNSSLCLALLWGDPSDCTQVGSGRGALDYCIHMDWFQECRRSFVCKRLNLAAAAFAICNAKEWLGRARRLLSGGGFVWWRAIDGGGFRECFAHTSPFSPRGL